MRLRLLSFTILFLLASSCAPKKETAIQIEPPPPLSEIEAPALPEPVPEPTAEDETTRPPSLGPVLIEEGDKEKYITLNFENADVRTVIDTIGEILGMNYILMPGISGTVTIQSYNKFPVSELYQIFQSILEINGLSVVRENTFYRIVPLASAREQPLDAKNGKELGVRLDGSFLTQVIPLQHVKTSEIANILRNLVPSGADIIVYDPANIILVNALPPAIVKAMKLINALDVPETESVRTFVYHVENGEAKKLAEILKNIYPLKEEKIPGTPAASRPGDMGGITVTAYEDINALIIKCTPKAYVTLLEVLKKIDVPVRQVVIEALIAEITLRDSTDFGVQWLLESGATVTGFNTSSTPRTGFASDPDPIFATLITGTIDKTFVQAFITALADESRVNVLANPHILALDNKEAEIKIGDEIPTATGLTQQPATGGGTTLVSSGQIQYRTVGTILKVTPHITEAGNVSMKLVIEKSGIGEDVTLGSGTFPAFTTQMASTSAVINTGQTLFIGGLISDSKTRTRIGIPLLSKIPVLGYLFGRTTDIIEKRELLVLVTPHVIGNQKEAREVTKEFQNRMRIIKKRLEKLDSGGDNVFLPGEATTEETTIEKAEEQGAPPP